MESITRAAQARNIARLSPASELHARPAGKLQKHKETGRWKEQRAGAYTLQQIRAARIERHQRVQVSGTRNDTDEIIEFDRLALLKSVLTRLGHKQKGGTTRFTRNDTKQHQFFV